jgi:hypothetical protein
VTYVGVHNRRTDHLEFIQKTSNLKPIEIDYFYDAMDYFRYLLEKFCRHGLHSGISQGDQMSL